MKKIYRKIFGIGLSRTGTVSLVLAFQLLGFKSLHCPLIMRNSSLLIDAKLLINRICIKFSKKAFKSRRVIFRNTFSKHNTLRLLPGLIDKYEAFADSPIARFYKELDERYPRSKFVLTVREMEPWLDSCRRHFQRKFTGGKFDQLSYELYGINVFEKNLFVNAYERHIKEVKRYFEGRENDLLVLNICAGEGFEKLCPFLDLPELEQPFPHRRH